MLLFATPTHLRCRYELAKFVERAICNVLPDRENLTQMLGEHVYGQFFVASGFAERPYQHRWDALPPPILSRKRIEHGRRYCAPKTCAHSVGDFFAAPVAELLSGALDCRNNQFSNFTICVIVHLPRAFLSNVQAKTRVKT